MSTKYLDENGLLYVKQKIAGKFVEKETGKGLSTNDYSTADKTKLSGIESGAEANIIESVKVNGTAQTVSSKAVDITVPTKLSDLTNDGDGTTGSKFATEDYADEHGGKIDKIKVNNVEQTISNKTVNIIVPTKTSDLTNDDNVVKDSSYVHTDNNYTTTEKNKLSGIDAGAEANVIETIKVNGSAQTVTSKEVDITVPTNNNQLTNGAGYQTASDVQSAIASQVGSAYKPAGSIAFANLPALNASNCGKVYNITDSFTTTSDFLEGAGKTYPAGTDVGIVNPSGTTYKYNVFAGFVDLSNYVETSDLVAITNAEIDTIFA